MQAAGGIMRRSSVRARGARGIGLGLVVSSALVMAGPSRAQDTPAESKPKAPLKIELNRLEQSGDACRTYMVVDNSRGTALKSLKIDIFAFDTEGVAQKRVAVELGPVAEKKTMVRLFDLAGLSCPKVGRVLLNDVLACEGADATREACLERIETASKTPATFDR